MAGLGGSIRFLVRGDRMILQSVAEGSSKLDIAIDSWQRPRFLERNRNGTIRQRRTGTELRVL